jgi:hypothetical protein
MPRVNTWLIWCKSWGCQFQITRIPGFHNHWPPKRERFEHTTMHYTIDPIKAKIRTLDHALRHQWPPKVRDSNLQTHNHALHHHWPPKSLRFEPKTMDLCHHCRQWPPKVKDWNTSPCTTPPLTLKKTMQDPRPCTPRHALHHIDHEGHNLFRWISRYVHVHFIRFLDHAMILVCFKLTWPPFSTHSCNQVYCRSYPACDK